MTVCRHFAMLALIALAGISSTRCAEPAVFHFDLSTAKDLPPEIRCVSEGPKGEACLRADVPPEGAAGASLATVPLDLGTLRGKEILLSYDVRATSRDRDGPALRNVRHGFRVVAAPVS